MKKEFFILTILIVKSVTISALPDTKIKNIPPVEQLTDKKCNKPDCQNSGNKICKQCNIFYCSQDCYTEDLDHKIYCTVITQYNRKFPYLAPPASRPPTNEEMQHLQLATLQWIQKSNS